MKIPAMLYKEAPRLRAELNELERAWFADEGDLVGALLVTADPGAERRRRIVERATELVQRVRARDDQRTPIRAFMQEYDLSSEEGVVLMCLAEALLRIPDADTAEKLIADKLAEANWESHLGHSSSLFVNASTWGLMLTGRLVRVSGSAKRNVSAVVSRLVNRSGEPVVRLAIRQAMRIMGHQFVMGRSIEEAMERAVKKDNRRYRFSFDMLGEAALTAADAKRYFEDYRHAIEVIGEANTEGDVYAAPGISVKLSALYPRCEVAQREDALNALSERLLQLAEQAARHGIALTVDAEEADRLTLSLEVFERVARAPSIQGWNGFGLAIQAYQRRAWYAVEFVAALGREIGRRFPVRLVKGAYWDTEIKHAQVEGWDGYPVFTRKANTDVSYLACARRMLEEREAIYPQFATHNAHTIAAIAEFAGDRLDLEYQRLHGMGDDLYGEVLDNTGFHDACRVYAPVGSHEDLLPYLVRRLLENGANTSFVNQVGDPEVPVEEVVADPIEAVHSFESFQHPRIPLPEAIYGDDRVNSRGRNLSDYHQLAELKPALEAAAGEPVEARPLLGGRKPPRDSGEPRRRQDPANPEFSPGTVVESNGEQVEHALEVATRAFADWSMTSAAERAVILERAADLMEQRTERFMAIAIREGGKTVRDAVAEVREAVDFLRYYAMQVRQHFVEPMVLPGPTGEHNQLSLHGRGVFACISPWNFLLAIFTGQVAAALAAGNTVLAKPAEQTPLIAHEAVRLLHEAGVPREVLQYLPGDGPNVGAVLTADPRLAGVAFTGSTETARAINRALAKQDGPVRTLIAETGGQNAMIVDSSALSEQVVKDVLASAFLSAGQRCSALRVLFVQEDVAAHMLEMLAGAVEELKVGDPGLLETDIGPVIDAGALANLRGHTERMEQQARLIAQAPCARGDGYFLAPCAYEIDGIGELEDEVFGPILHVVRYKARDLDRVIEAINKTGYGLTLGVHSRIESVQRYIAERVRVGNTYVNRTMIGSVVGVQPFGGERLSGTGPKAGGPHYLLRFASERTLTVNTAAVGGNASLLALGE